MNDFLSSFDKKSYEKEEEKKPEVKKPIDPKDKKQREEERVEVFEIDEDRRKKRKRNTIIIGAAAAVAFVIIGVSIYLSGQIKVPNFVDGRITEAQKWAIQKGIHLEIVEVFSIELDEEYVISQSVKENKKVRKGDSITLEVSKGADPDEKIDLPDFSKMNGSEIEQWKKDNRLTGVTINKVFSDDVETNKFIKKEFKDPTVTEATFRRRDYLIISISKGPEVLEKNITVPDFKGKSVMEATTWADTNGIQLTQTESYSDTIQEGLIISQSITAKTKVAKGDTLNIVVSKGKALVVPNFSGLSRDAATAKASEAGVSVLIVDAYNEHVAYGSFINQSHSAGTILTNQTTTITLTFSLGTPFIPDLQGKSLEEATHLITEMNSKGARLTYSIIEVTDQNVKPGVVITNTYAGIAGFDISTVITVSKGSQVQVMYPSLVRQYYTSEETQRVIADLQARGLTVVVKYEKFNTPSGVTPIESGQIGKLVRIEGTASTTLSSYDYLDPNGSAVINSQSQILQIVVAQ